MLERIGNCRILEEIASGGMAVVYRAIQDPLGRTVAIKALKTSAAAEENVVTRFEREAKSLANLQHENIIHVYDFHHERGAMFIVMEYVKGIDLYDLLEKCGRLPYDVAAIVCMQVARALDYIHYRGIVHRDIKPANIMIARTGGVKVMDFGIARLATRSEGVTQAGMAIGTPEYMAPEQLLGDNVDFRADIYAAGCVLFECLTGRTPFIADSPITLVAKQLEETPPSPASLNAEVPEALAQLILRTLSKNPDDRPQNYKELRQALNTVIGVSR